MTFWYQSKLTMSAAILLPLSLLVWAISTVRRRRRNQNTYSIPVIVVGNLTVGGTGKTPTIIWLVKQLQSRGYNVAVVSRGYRAKPDRDFPVSVNRHDSARSVGDEPKLIHDQTRAEVLIDPDRHRAVLSLCHRKNESRPDVIISDDGLQHYRMARDLEILMVDSQRGLGNGMCLPAGPLRESASRLSTVSFRLAKQPGPYDRALKLDVASEITGLAKNKDGSQLEPQPVQVHTAIGNSDSFRVTVEQLGYEVKCLKSYRDHNKLPLADIESSPLPVLVTEKDAIKLQHWPDNLYVVSYALEYGPDVSQNIIDSIKDLANEKSRHHTGSL